MNSKFKILLLIAMGFVFYTSVAQVENHNLLLFTDRDFCISGDSVWIKVWFPEFSEKTGNIVRVQLASKNNNLISEIAVRSKNNWAQGFIFIPDSLSTGQYFVTAFLNNQLNNKDLDLENKSILIYNRFTEGISQMEIIQSNFVEQKTGEKTVLSLTTDKEHYQTREKVECKIDINPGIKIKSAVIKATLIDPLATEIKGTYKFRMQSPNSTIPDFIETDGLLLGGKVTDINGIAQSGALVVLSIEGTQPYFDYYVLGENGDFHFFLKNAFGNANVVLQVVSNSEKQYFIQLENNYIERKEVNPGQIKILNPGQVEFINTAVNANFAQKLFNPSISVQSVNCEIPERFSNPFYGQPTERVIPDQFIDLPDFQEISREILPGVQYRLKNDEVTIRIINNTYRMFFEEEPLRLINGIPVFKNDLFVNLKSTDISYIDIVKNERIFGDLIFKGVLAVSLINTSNSWLAQQPNIFQFNVNFLQLDKNPGYLTEQILITSQPDMRQVYFWNLLVADSLEEIDFYLSDRKGKVEISVEGFTPNNEFFKTSKTIEVK